MRLGACGLIFVRGTSAYRRFTAKIKAAKPDSLNLCHEFDSELNPACWTSRQLWKFLSVGRLDTLFLEDHVPLQMVVEEQSLPGLWIYCWMSMTVTVVNRLLQLNSTYNNCLWQGRSIMERYIFKLSTSQVLLGVSLHNRTLSLLFMTGIPYLSKHSYGGHFNSLIRRRCLLIFTSLLLIIFLWLSRSSKMDLAVTLAAGITYTHIREWARSIGMCLI
ncbi:hypothetical protein PILCRDRAFT_466101 [Piloderma croceum F 1598]|uniref:Uncharacterized protein n=1 Tax=Piloderma croceum (strain F 1598) TaxID=765440 RepID=A0A0C3FS08_PILCF|nr:hypothetical protein PILCRDRAFT_466101 [Piloderma croceum F 1598]